MKNLLVLLSIIFLLGCKKTETVFTQHQPVASGTFTFSINGMPVNGYIRTCNIVTDGTDKYLSMGGNSGEQFSPTYVAIFYFKLPDGVIKNGDYFTDENKNSMLYKYAYASNSYNYYESNITTKSKIKITIKDYLLQNNIRQFSCSFDGTITKTTTGQIYTISNSNVNCSVN